MNKIIIVFLLAGIGDLCAQGREEKAVKETFSNYKKSILESKGVEAAKWVDTNTIVHYDKILRTAIDADSAEVAALGLLDRLTVLSVRHRIPKEDIDELDGKQFFQYSIENGMVGKNTVMNIEIGTVKIEGDFASGQLVSNGAKSPLYFQFNKENGLWKLDLTSVFPASNAGLKKLIADQGMTENEFIFQALETLTGKAVSNAIWQPM